MTHRREEQKTIISSYSVCFNLILCFRVIILITSVIKTFFLGFLTLRQRCNIFSHQVQCYDNTKVPVATRSVGSSLSLTKSNSNISRCFVFNTFIKLFCAVFNKYIIAINYVLFVPELKQYKKACGYCK